MSATVRFRSRRVRVVAAVVTVVTASAVVPAASSTAAGPIPAQATRPADQSVQEPATVTLVTGDRVTLRPSANGQPSVTFAPRPGEPARDFSVLRKEDGVHVVPNDVADLIPTVLDPDLFNVTALVEMGYDDASTDKIPVIVERAAGVRTLASTSPIQTEKRLSSVDAVAATLDKDAADDLGADLTGLESVRRRSTTQALGGATKIWLDGVVESVALDGYLEQVNAPTAWESGLDGSGVTVAVLDSGVDAEHPALAGQVDAQQNFTDGPSADDGHGHGTHVASILAGNGAGSDGARQGIAHGADVLSGKVLDDTGHGLESWVIAGMEWAAAEGADVVNLSLGGPAGETDDLLVQSLETLTEQTGTLFVAAAGNNGSFWPDPFSIGSPGTAASALTVGAVNSDDVQAVFSSEGPTRGSYRLKPDVSAPGVNILGARAGARDGDLYTPMSGTSMATPVVAGAAALLLQQHPDWTWQQVKAQIVTTADPHRWFTAWTHGSGRLDLARATGQTLFSDTANLDYGYLKHPDDALRERGVTLTNTGSEPVTVDVADSMHDRDGDPAPDGALTAAPATLTVPPGGSASTTITFDPGQLEDGRWQGVLTFGSDGSTLLRLPVGAYDEPERYDLEVQVLDRNGDPYDPAAGDGVPNADPTLPIFNADTGFFYRLHLDSNGRATARVAPGEYMAFARVVTPATNGNPQTLAVAGTSELLIDSDTSYVIDARKAEQLDAPTIAGQDTEPRLAVGVTYARHSESRGYIEMVFFDPQQITNGQVFITPTVPVDSGTFEATTRWRLAPVGKVKPSTPDVYELVFNEPVFTDPLSPRLSRRQVHDLAKVNDSFYPVGGPGEYPFGSVAETVDTRVGTVFRTPVDVPTSRLVLRTAKPDVSWGGCLYVPANDMRALCDDLHGYEPGERVEEEYGAAVHPAVVASRHSPGSMFVSVGISDGTHAGKLGVGVAAEATLALHTADGELVGRADDTYGYFPADEGRFRLTQDLRLKPGVLTGAQRAHTVWEFDSAPPPDQGQWYASTPPLLTVDYGPQVDAVGTIAARRPLRLNLQLGHVDGAEAAERIGRARLWWSTDDGDRWRAARVRRTGEDTFRATVLPGGALRSGDDLSLRLVAADADGNSIDQTVVDVLHVR